MKQLRRAALGLALLLSACPAPGDPDDDDAALDDDDAVSPDPLALAEEVSQAELEASILALEDFGTRFTFSDGDDAARDYLVDRLAELGFMAELDPFEVSGHSTANVMARLEGVERPERVWIYSAHYDSTSNEPDVYAPGADDNASGVAAVLEAARILGDLRFEESIWFVFTGAEEQGSRGSEHMVGWLDDESVEVQGVIAPDMIGYWPLGDEDLMDILGDESSVHLVEAMGAVADELGVAHKDWIEHSFCYGDDHSNFQEAGIPAISPMDCVEAHNVPSSGESTPHYHRITDTFSTLHMPFTTRVSGVIVASLAEWAGPLPSD